MRVSINQPAYLPWLGYFQRIAMSDVHIVLDHVQFEKNSFTNRNKIRTAQGWTWLTIPVRTTGKFGELPIHTLEIAEEGFGRKHWQTLRQSYAKAPYFAEHAGFFEETYTRPWPTLMPLMEHMNGYLLKAFGITTPMQKSSGLGITSRKAELVLDLCKATGATEYLSGPLGRDYLDEAAFGAAGITLAYHDVAHPAYSQAYPGFEPYMAALDLLFNHGPRSREILMENAHA